MEISELTILTILLLPIGILYATKLQAFPSQIIAIIIILVLGLASVSFQQTKQTNLSVSAQQNQIQSMNDDSPETNIPANKTNITQEIINKINSKEKYIILSNQYSSSMREFLQKHDYKKVATTPDGNVYELQEPKRTWGWGQKEN